MTVSIYPTRESLIAFAEKLPAEMPVTMLNLLRFNTKALYSGEAEPSSISGVDAYAIYARLLMPLLEQAGGEIVWLGKACSPLIAPPEEIWDEVVLVRYPDKDAFMRMTGSDAYKAIVHHRTAALADSRLFPLLQNRSAQSANSYSYK